MNLHLTRAQHTSLRRVSMAFVGIRFKGVQDRKKVFKTAEEAVEHLFSEEFESEMIVLPPEVDEFTDEEGFDDSETLDPSVRDLICPIICKMT
ncbi:hypothetical protein NPIL_101911 [Nephila pilipes]|uniref:Uncharacterized protein n=1 Tax=Nephila pilipes TaxID=299642 RepID=A0A8X6PE65_NEPPI|nr:hypothetical protein NPIL_101911 [Nephila pilipes]